MHLLPNHQSEVIEDSKLLGYALNPQSERGQHKARVFESALGCNLSNWEHMKRAIVDALPYHEAGLMSETVFGKKYEVVVSLTGPNGRTVDVATIWQFDRLHDEDRFADVPRLVTLYIA